MSGQDNRFDDFQANNVDSWSLRYRIALAILHYDYV